MKIGRNEPCACGSGRKHKKCCLEKSLDLGQDQKEDDFEDLISPIFTATGEEVMLARLYFKIHDLGNLKEYLSRLRCIKWHSAALWKSAYNLESFNLGS